MIGHQCCRAWSPPLRWSGQSFTVHNYPARYLPKSHLINPLLVVPLLAVLAEPPRPNTIADSTSKVVDLSFRNNWVVGLTADFPLPFSPQRKLRRWLGLKLYTCKSIFQVGLSFSPQHLSPRGTWSSSTWPRGSCQPSSPTPSPLSQPISI